MPFLAPLFGIIAQWLSIFLFNLLTVFARATAWNVALAAFMVAGVGVAIATFINIITSYASTLISQTSTIPVIPYFLPSNLGYCLSAYVTVMIAGTIFNATINFLENKTYILKA